MKTKIIAIPSVLALGALSITACSNPDEKPAAAGTSSSSQTSSDLSFDTSSIQAVP